MVQIHPDPPNFALLFVAPTLTYKHRRLRVEAPRSAQNSVSLSNLVFFTSCQKHPVLRKTSQLRTGFAQDFSFSARRTMERARECTYVHDRASDECNAVRGRKRQAKRGHSSAGRAPALHAGGRRFDPAWLHHLTYKLLGGSIVVTSKPLPVYKQRCF